MAVKHLITRSLTSVAPHLFDHLELPITNSPDGHLSENVQKQDLAKVS